MAQNINIDKSLNNFFRDVGLNDGNDEERIRRNSQIKSLMETVIKAQKDSIYTQGQLNQVIADQYNLLTSINDKQLQNVYRIKQANEEEKIYSQGSLQRKKEIIKQQQEELNLSIQILTQERNQTNDVNNRKRLNSELHDSKKKANQLSEQANKIEEELNKRREESLKAETQHLNVSQRFELSEKARLELKKKQNQIEKERQEALSKAKTKTQKASINKKYDQEEKDAEDESMTSSMGIGFLLGGIGAGSSGNQIVDLITDNLSEALGKAGGPVAKIVTILTKIASTIAGFANQGLEKYLSLQTESLASINSRLDGVYGDENPWNAIDQFVNNVGFNRYVNMENLYRQIASLNEIGIAFNLEQRALLTELKDTLVTTFDATNDNLLRLIRLQQTDLTYSQMGVEAALTKFLSNLFLDSSYLNGEQNTVFGTLLEGSSNIKATDIAGWTFAIQKWLGSLYSIGMSAAGVESLAQGLSYLSSGNLDALTSNDSLNNLFAMASQKAGMNYADLLLSGTTVSDINKLMKSVVELLQEISSNTDTNNVLKNAFGNIYGLTISDINAVKHLSSGDISTIYQTNLTYDAANAWTTNAIESIPNRMPIATQLRNVTDNALMKFVTTYMVDSLFGENSQISPYVTWQLSKVTKEIVGENLLTDFIDILTGAGTIANVLMGSATGKNFNLASLVDNMVRAEPSIDTLKVILSDYSSGTVTTSRGSFDLSGAESNTVRTDFSGSTSYGDIENPITNSDNTQSSSDTYGANSNGIIIKDVSDVWTDLFKTKKSMRVEIVSFENQALVDLFGDDNRPVKEWIKELHDIIKENNMDSMNDNQSIYEAIQALKG